MITTNRELEYFMKLEIIDRLKRKREIWQRQQLNLEIDDIDDPQLSIIVAELDNIDQEIKILQDQIAFLQYGGV